VGVMNQVRLEGDWKTDTTHSQATAS
jgi:hypothetical protein